MRREVTSIGAHQYRLIPSFEKTGAETAQNLEDMKRENEARGSEMEDRITERGKEKKDSVKGTEELLTAVLSPRQGRKNKRHNAGTTTPFPPENTVNENDIKRKYTTEGNNGTHRTENCERGRHQQDTNYPTNFSSRPG